MINKYFDFVMTLYQSPHPFPPPHAQLCCTKYGRDYLRDKQCYLILRELHKWETDPEAKKVNEDVVHILISDEHPGLENFEEIELPAKPANQLQIKNE